MDTLPVEILFEIIDYLTPREQVLLQFVSKSFLALARDNILWKLHCYEQSWANYETTRPRPAETASLVGNPTASLSSLGRESLRSLIQPRSTASNETGPDGQNGHSSSLAERSRAATAWDPSYEKEEIDWYSEYRDRHGPISFNWLQQPYTRSRDNKKEAPEVKGIGLLRDRNSAGHHKVAAPLEDGSVCIWDLNHSYSAMSQSTKGRVLGVSAPGILTASDSASEFLNLGECVSVDSVRRRAYMAVGNVLNEVDLETLQVVTQQRYPCPVFALSQETDYSAPLTLATWLNLYIHDPRLSAPGSVEPDATYALLSQPNPLSILHPPSLHEHAILVAGRFPAILHYDRRFFPHLQNIVHSGGSLCGLASAPSPQFPVRSDSNGADVQKIVACGEYKGRGSLELYNLTPSETSSSLSSAAYQNRQSAARSKLLSVASHGVRLVYSDADGNVKWVERDGRSKVRRWNINTHLSDMKANQRTANSGAAEESDEDDSETGGLFASSRGNNEVVQKVMPTGGSLMGDELLIWTGERIGRLQFSGIPEPDLNQGDEEEDIPIDEELDSTTRERLRGQRREQLRRENEYARTMRRALERQADEVRRMGGFGL
ncbi:hypothetical protein SI65_00536 [Aspergillus cristatus]|uniref:F-box domain-containing protein n=1 Tax=Aspergillus cristatus TaxID=573508 RepID=A0A1E3BPY8_ASPCR|nr:hypothetical protein SI65_00536 [Aspergillus cristatus]